MYVMNNEKGNLKMDLTNSIIRYENGEMDSKREIVELFQELINTGMAWKLQGHYGRTAAFLIQEGLCMHASR